eukprot:COSAG02_NODE_134_length_34593_cov_43.594886_10_plen_200_part_00
MYTVHVVLRVYRGTLEYSTRGVRGTYRYSRIRLYAYSRRVRALAAPLAAARQAVAIRSRPAGRAQRMAFDPSTLTALGWRHTHKYDSPDVVAARKVLQQRNGIAGLETVSPTQAGYATRAAELFHRDGFVVLTDVRCLPIAGCSQLQATVQSIAKHSSRPELCTENPSALASFLDPQFRSLRQQRSQPFVAAAQGSCRK